MANGSDTGSWKADNSGWDRDSQLFTGNNQSHNKPEKLSYHTTAIEFISDIERISEIEAKSEEKLDRGLFTTKEVLNAVMNGFKIGLFSNIFIFAHIVIVTLLSFSFVVNFLHFEPAPFYFLKYLFAIVVIIVTLFISALSRLAVGGYTNKAITSFFTGKFLSSFTTGILILFLLGYFRAVTIDNYNSIVAFLTNHTNTPFELATSDLNHFINSFPSLYYEVIALVLISSFMPFMFF